MLGRNYYLEIEVAAVRRAKNKLLVPRYEINLYQCLRATLHIHLPCLDIAGFNRHP